MKRIDSVELNIDYKIIQHFSEHLYGTPHKAVEELVSNGFDAFAERVYVYTPGPKAADVLIVWDDGWSMDVEGLKHLWWIARSPKDHGERILTRDGHERKIIGKFGIGKLASYAVGDEIVHLCRRGSQFLRVSVDYGEIQIMGTSSDVGDSEVDKPEPPRQSVVTRPIEELTELEAREYVDGLFVEGSNARAIAEVFDRDQWTLAVVGKLRDGLKAGRLAWILSNGLPLRPDFRVFLNDDRVVPKVEGDAKIEWDMSAPELQEAIVRDWEDASVTSEVIGTPVFGVEQGLDYSDANRAVPYVALPILGKVWGSVRLFARSLVKGRSADHGRSHGFFSIVRGRLINADDDKLFLHDPSFRTFYSSQFVLHADGLDAELLADRERLRRDRPRARAVAALQGALYRAARAKITALDEMAADSMGLLTLLPVSSREYFREPLMALLSQAAEEERESFDFVRPAVDRRTLGYDKPVAEIDGDGFHVNASHPYYKAFERRVGNRKGSDEFFRAYDLFAVAEPLMRGHLVDMGFDDDQVEAVLRWRDGLFREFATSFDRNPGALAENLVNSSYEGHAAFEVAIADVLNDMGFRATRVGKSGQHDGIMAAAVGPESYVLTFEGKGSKHPIANDDAEVASAASHCRNAGASHAVIIAREFAGFKKKNAPAVVEECNRVGGVSIMTVDALVALHDVVLRFGLPLDLIKEIFTRLETPEEKRARIEQLSQPTDIDYRGLLHEIWEQQHGSAWEDMVSYRPIWQRRFRDSISFDEFEIRLIGLEALSGNLLRVSKKPQLVIMHQAPEIVIARIERAFGGAES